MGRTPHSTKNGLNRGAWTALEDKMLTDYVSTYGEGKWSNVAKKTGLKRCGKSCRLRWLNYLRPDIKRGNISHDEELLILRLHKLLGNRWSLIAGRLPGRTDNEIKNYWNSNLAKKAQDFQLLLPTLGNRQSATASPIPLQKEDQTLPFNISRSFETESVPEWPSGEGNSEADFLIDFNMEEFCEILDPPTKTVDVNDNNNKEVKINEYPGGKLEGKYWDGNECAESELGGTELMSMVSFLDSGQGWLLH